MIEPAGPGPNFASAGPPVGNKKIAYKFSYPTQTPGMLACAPLAGKRAHLSSRISSMPLVPALVIMIFQLASYEKATPNVSAKPTKVGRYDLPVGSCCRFPKTVGEGHVVGRIINTVGCFDAVPISERPSAEEECKFEQPEDGKTRTLPLSVT